MQGPINIRGVVSAHSSILQQTNWAVDSTLQQAGDVALHIVATDSGFKHPTGNLAKKTEAQVVRTSNGAILRLRNREKYANAQELGSGTHAGRGKYPIVAKRARFLRFIGRNGNPVIVRRVMHPGVPATRFLWRATVKAGGQEKAFLEVALGRIARRFNRLRV